MWLRPRGDSKTKLPWCQTTSVRVPHIPPASLCYAATCSALPPTQLLAGRAAGCSPTRNSPYQKHRTWLAPQESGGWWPQVLTDWLTDQLTDLTRITHYLHHMSKPHTAWLPVWWWQSAWHTGCCKIEWKDTHHGSFSQHPFLSFKIIPELWRVREHTSHKPLIVSKPSPTVSTTSFSFQSLTQTHTSADMTPTSVSLMKQWLNLTETNNYVMF